MKIDYKAIWALNPQGEAVQSDDGKNWEKVKGMPTKAIVFHVNWNKTLSGPYVRSYANLTVKELLKR